MTDITQTSGRMMVAPLAGAWIEIVVMAGRLEDIYVAPLAGAWIEIRFERSGFIVNRVAPLAGAWIEIASSYPVWIFDECRSPCGSVD